MRERWSLSCRLEFGGGGGEAAARQFVEIAIFVDGVAVLIDLAFFQHNGLAANGAGNRG